MGSGAWFWSTGQRLQLEAEKAVRKGGRLNRGRRAVRKNGGLNRRKRSCGYSHIYLTPYRLYCTQNLVTHCAKFHHTRTGNR